MITNERFTDRMGLSIKDARSQGRVVQCGHFCSQGG